MSSTPVTPELPAPTTTPSAALRTLGAAVTVLLVAGLLACSVVGGMPLPHALAATLVVLGTQVLPGALAWRAARPRDGWLLEDLAMGFAVGSVLAIGAQVVAGLTGQPWVAFSPLAVAVVLVLVPGTRTRLRTARTRPLPWWCAPSVALLALVTLPQLRSYFRAVPLHWGTGSRAIDVDAYLHLALAGQLAHRGPTTFPWVQSESLAYHWFSHAWVAQVSVASGVPLDEVLFRFMAVLMPIVVVFAIATAAVRLTGRAWAGPVAGLLAFVGGDLNVLGKNASASPVAPLSPSLGLAIPMVVAAAVVLALRWNKSMSGGGGLVLLVVLCLGASGTKGSTLPLLVAGLGLTLAAMLVFDRSRVLSVAGDLAVVVGCLLFALVVVFHGSGAGLHLSPSDAADQIPAASWLGKPGTRFQMALILAIGTAGVLARGAGALVLPFSRTGRRSPTSWLLIGGGLAGAGAVALFAHPGRSQWYFARTAIPLLVLGSAMGLAAMVSVLGARRFARALIVGVSAGVALVWLGPAVLGTLRPGGWGVAESMIAVGLAVVAAAGAAGAAWTRGRVNRLRLAGAAMVLTVLAGGVLSSVWYVLFPPGQTPVSQITQAISAPPLPTVPVTARLATSRGQIDAARWIRDHSDVHDLVMTNRHCTGPVAPVNCDSRRWTVAAFSERQVLVEGWTATPMSAKLGPEGRDSITVNYWKPDLLRLNDGFIADPTEDAARELRRLGVRWIFVDHTRPYAPTLEPYATLRYRSPGVDVYEFPG
ncbi:hypothetical protein ODJ79_03895 [Actinoplanes sp. KI2]|uniref:hypothetical protein n=1 Tax=Actinoplanes sp. KI2 TaxID=2983315 RepID=UPI0021D5E8D8|nr:hypothetical protein [Actinoplanes sp. KI2]MCU7722848.1 hypothetical protein [Actinoplanes sp. KI2]